MDSGMDMNGQVTQLPSGKPPFPDMMWIPGGSFLMGSDTHYPEEGPTHPVVVDGFWMDVYPVTNEAFARFAAATGYVTVAERPLDPADYPGADPELLVPGALVFQRRSRPVDLRDVSAWWAYVPGASWRHPQGPASSLEGRERHPVVQVTYEDAAAYAAWVGKALPSEATWERAARGGLEGAVYVWGDEFMPDGQLLANIWLGDFPWQTQRPDGHVGTMPVGSYPPNGFGLFDMAGNVWQWTSDWYAPRHTEPARHACCAPMNPRGGAREDSFDPALPAVHIPRKVLKGGSYLCAANYCLRYRPAARSPQMIDSATSHIGFRCVVAHNREKEGPASRETVQTTPCLET
jgi:formylglycine-generating enzyme required for sulfatase activity